MAKLADKYPYSVTLFFATKKAAQAFAVEAAGFMIGDPEAVLERMDSSLVVQHASRAKAIQIKTTKKEGL